MEHIIGEYYECNGAIFRKLKLREGKCQIRTPEGKYMWVRPSDNTTFITRSDNITKPEATEAPSDITTFTTSSDITTFTTECDNITSSDNTTSITDVQGVHPDNGEGYGTIGDIERRTPRTPVRNMYEENDKIYEPDENGMIW